MKENYTMGNYITNVYTPYINYKIDTTFKQELIHTYVALHNERHPVESYTLHDEYSNNKGGFINLATYGVPNTIVKTPHSIELISNTIDKNKNIKQSINKKINKLIHSNLFYKTFFKENLIDKPIISILNLGGPIWGGVYYQSPTYKLIKEQIKKEFSTTHAHELNAIVKELYDANAFKITGGGDVFLTGNAKLSLS